MNHSLLLLNDRHLVVTLRLLLHLGLLVLPLCIWILNITCLKRIIGIIFQILQLLIWIYSIVIHISLSCLDNLRLGGSKHLLTGLLAGLLLTVLVGNCASSLYTMLLMSCRCLCLSYEVSSLLYWNRLLLPRLFVYLLHMLTLCSTWHTLLLLLLLLRSNDLGRRIWLVLRLNLCLLLHTGRINYFI